MFFFFFFFFNDTATTEIYTLSLHDALPICRTCRRRRRSRWSSVSCSRAPINGSRAGCGCRAAGPSREWSSLRDRKSTRLNSSHSQISYAVFCLKKKKKHNTKIQREHEQHNV